MPELDFVLPHWLYWGGLVVFPLVAWWLYHKQARRGETAPVSLAVAYFLWLVGGFMGVHRLYLKSRWAAVFMLLFVGILVTNVEVRQARNDISDAHNQIRLAEGKIRRAEKALAKGRRNAEQKMARARTAMTKARQAETAANENGARIETLSRTLGGLVLLLLAIDALLLPRLVRKARRLEPAPPPSSFHCPAMDGSEHDPSREPLLFNRLVGRINGFVGELVAWWSVLAVFVYYYEVIARYVFNSPTNWAHEAMFLMFGMQYLLAGGYVLREGAHVRVDVFYTRLSQRGKALVDILTSVFFFIFTLTLIWTGWTFFMDSYQVNEVSFTEWAVQYWPIKFALPLGGLLLLLQGLAQLLKDIAVLRDPATVELNAATRPGG